jgi:putative transposase
LAAATNTVIKCRIYPTKEQEARLQSTLDICREIYNYFVFESRVAYKEGDDKLEHNEMSSIVPGLTKGKEIYSKVAQPVADRFFRNLSVLAAARKKKGRKVVGNLRFKSKEQYKTFTYNQSGFKIIDDGKLLKLSKIGKIKIMLHRNIIGKIKEVHIKHEKSGKWFAIFVCREQAFASQCFLARERIIGIDVGINNFVYDSDGGVSENPAFLRRSEKKLSKAQRVLSRRKKGSANRQKQRRKVAKVHQKIANQRNVFLHRLSHYYVDKYDTISQPLVLVSTSSSSPYL